MVKRALSAALLLAVVAACNARAEEPQGEVPARGLAIDDRPLSDIELSEAIASLGRTYGIAVEAAVP